VTGSLRLRPNSVEERFGVSLTTGEVWRVWCVVVVFAATGSFLLPKRGILVVVLAYVFWKVVYGTARGCIKMNSSISAEQNKEAHSTLIYEILVSHQP
jgi:hypothetical protein